MIVVSFGTFVRICRHFWSWLVLSYLTYSRPACALILIADVHPVCEISKAYQ